MDRYYAFVRNSVEDVAFLHTRDSTLANIVKFMNGCDWDDPESWFIYDNDTRRVVWDSIEGDLTGEQAEKVEPVTSPSTSSLIDWMYVSNTDLLRATEVLALRCDQMWRSRLENVGLGLNQAYLAVKFDIGKYDGELRVEHRASCYFGGESYVFQGRDMFSALDHVATNVSNAHAEQPRPLLAHHK